MPILSIRHLTRYRYRKPVAIGEHRMMFRPLESYDQRVISASVEISPEPDRLRHVHDVFGNAVGIATFRERARELCFESRVTLDHRPVPAFDGVESYEERLPLAYSPEDMPDLLRSMERGFADPEGAVERWARSFLPRGRRANLQRVLADMTQAIHSDFRYGTRLHGAAQSPTETLASRTGACRDFAVLMMEAARSLGLAAQFVSGYIHVPPRPTAGLIGTSKLGGGHTHAWLRVYMPACGWVEFDPTNGIVGNTDLIRVAIARDPKQALPLWGSWSGEADDYLGMDVEVQVVSDEAPPPLVQAGWQPDLAVDVG